MIRVDNFVITTDLRYQWKYFNIIDSKSQHKDPKEHKEREREREREREWEREREREKCKGAKLTLCIKTEACLRNICCT